MVDKLTHPDLRPVYSLDVSLDTVEGYGHVRAMVDGTSTAFPEDEYHVSVHQVADQILLEATRDEIGQAQTLEREIRSKGVVKNIANLSGVADIQQRIDAQVKEAERLTEAAGSVFDDVLSEASPEERDVIRSIAQRKIDAALAEHDTHMGELSTSQLAMEAVVRITQRPIPRLSSIDRQSRYEVPLPNPDISLSELQSLNRILEMGRNGIMAEHTLVATLFPEYFANNRPEAFRLFDEMYGRLGNLHPSQLNNYDKFIQRGRLHHTDPTGRVVGRFVNTVYRGLPVDDQQVKSKRIVEQRLEIDAAPHVILWNEVTPSRS